MPLKHEGSIIGEISGPPNPHIEAASHRQAAPASRETPLLRQSGEGKKTIIGLMNYANMKKQFPYITVGLILAVLSLSCSRKSEQASPNSPDPNAWPEMESFHMVMAEAYHPYKDTMNLEPVKGLAENLAKESEKWSAAPLPEKMKTQEVKAKLEKLKIDSRNLADLVKKGATDEQIGNSLSALHERFHTISEVWNGSNAEKHEKH